MNLTPENMVLIPKGSFLYGKKKRSLVINYDFWMDIYLVTNRQYQKFIEARGYGQHQYWSNEGWEWSQEHNIDQPDYPVVGVSYYEAEAFASWLGKRLPNEEEWEKAARGVDGREYPWGSEFDPERCNGHDSLIRETTPINKYEPGQSPYGCYDMVGNVFEWTSSLYYKNENVLVIRGGSWQKSTELLRTSSRAWNDPDDRCNENGFRLAQDLSE